MEPLIWEVTLYGLMITMYLAVFYTDVAGISAVTVGMIMLISKFVDACTDVMMGALVDRTRTRWENADHISYLELYHLLFLR